MQVPFALTCLGSTSVATDAPIDPRAATMDLGSAPALVKHANTNAHIPTTTRADGKGNKGAC